MYIYLFQMIIVLILFINYQCTTTLLFNLIYLIYKIILIDIDENKKITLI